MSHILYGKVDLVLFDGLCLLDVPGLVGAGKVYKQVTTALGREHKDF